MKLMRKFIRTIRKVAIKQFFCIIREFRIIRIRIRIIRII